MSALADRIVKAAADLRDRLTDSPVGTPLVYPFALDVIASTPMLAKALAAEIEKQP